jgi:hypothetical protein
MSDDEKKVIILALDSALAHGALNFTEIQLAKQLREKLAKEIGLPLKKSLDGSNSAF